jgi:hypothetical protein
MPKILKRKRKRTKNIFRRKLREIDSAVLQHVKVEATILSGSVVSWESYNVQRQDLIEVAKIARQVFDTLPPNQQKALLDLFRDAR